MSLDLFITNVCNNPTFMLSLVINVSSFLFWLLLAVNSLQSLVYTLCNPPLHPLYTLEEILLAVKPLDCPLWIHFSFEHCWHHFYDQ